MSKFNDPNDFDDFDDFLDSPNDQSSCQNPMKENYQSNIYNQIADMKINIQKIQKKEDEFLDKYNDHIISKETMIENLTKLEVQQRKNRAFVNVEQ